MDDFLKDSFDNIRQYLYSVSIDESWVTKETLLKTYDCVFVNLDKQYEQSSHELSYIFKEKFVLAEQTQKTIDVLQIWELDNKSSSITSLIIYAIERLGFTKDDEKYIKSLLIASVLAEVKNDLPYHNNLHFRKVVLHMVRMIVAHNNIFSDTHNFLDKAKVTRLLISAAIHDLDHKGRGNIIDRHYHMAKLEKHSFKLSQPYFKAAGIDNDILADISIMLITTDTSPFGDPISPSNQARSAYEYHFGANENVEDLDLVYELIILQERDDLCLMCIMLHEADILNSAGVDYQVTINESIAVSEELGMDNASPENTLLFLEKICNSEMLSDSARQIASDNMADILSKVMDDYRDSNKFYIYGS